MKLTLNLVKPDDYRDRDWVIEMVEEKHYLRTWPHPKARPMSYIVKYEGLRLGLAVVTCPHATKCRGWWGYEDLPTKWQVVDVSRIWLHPNIQKGGVFCKPEIVPGFMDRKNTWRPAAASWLVSSLLARVQKDRIKIWPPVYPNQPYHILLAISYHDPNYHNGTIYKQSRALPVHTDKGGNPTPGKTGKYCWAWQLEKPNWSWNEIKLIRPRQLRFCFDSLNIDAQSIG
jgi:hypothetical protein